MSEIRKITRWAAEEHGHVIAACPDCDRDGTLRRGVHVILPDGGVMPSFICPHCDWHGWVRLVGWPSATNEESRL